MAISSGSPSIASCSESIGPRCAKDAFAFDRRAPEGALSIGMRPMRLSGALIALAPHFPRSKAYPLLAIAGYVDRDTATPGRGCEPDMPDIPERRRINVAEGVSPNSAEYALANRPRSEKPMRLPTCATVVPRGAVLSVRRARWRRRNLPYPLGPIA